LLQKVSGNDLAIPHLRCPLDLTILERVATLFPPLGDQTGWGAKFGRELNATDDRRVFQSAGAGLPVIEGKHLEPFRARARGARWAISSADADRLVGQRHHRARLAYRDVASSTNRMTLISAVLPAGCVSTHTIFCLRTRLSLRNQHFLCGLFNSFVLNYFVRLRVTTHVTTAIVERLPVPAPGAVPETAREIARLAIQLARRRGEATGVLAKLNALVAELYQLTETEFSYVLSTFPLVPIQDRDDALSEFRKRL
jgi:hypothetical protein